MQQKLLLPVIRKVLSEINIFMERENSFKFSGLIRRFNGLVLLNILGLALGLAAVIFIAIWVCHELSYDRFFKNADRIYRVESLINSSGDPSVWNITPAPVAKSVINDFPEVQDAVVLQSGYESAIKIEDKLFTAENLYYTNHSYFNIFSTKVISGDPSMLLAGPDDIVISRHVAEAFFRDVDPVGKTVLFNNNYLLTVSGVIENSPSNTHLKVDYLVPFAVLEKQYGNQDSWGRMDFITYILLKEETDASGFNTKLSAYWQTKISGLSGTLFINPLTRLYLYRDPGFDSIKYPATDKGPITRVILFSVIGFVLLLIACINFINLSTAFASQRAKEIGIRKVNGAGRKNLVIQLFGESLFQTSLATLTAVIIVILLLPVFVRVSGVEFSLQMLFSFRNILIYLILTLTTGFITGIYPALILSTFNPVKVIKPLPQDAIHGSGLRKILVVIQFGLAIIFIFCILVINRQVSYMQQSDLGFDKERVMTMYPHIKRENIEAIAEQIEKIPGVTRVALGGNVPVNMGNFNTIKKWDGNISGKPLMFFMMQVDDKYLDLLGMRITVGRQFFKGTIGTEVIINESAVKMMEMKDPLGKKIWIGDIGYTIIGIVADFHFHKLKDEIKPVFIYKNKDWWAKRIFVKLEPGNHFQVVGKIVDLVQKNSPGFPVNYMFLDQETDKYYENERKLSILINAATILTIVISCIGLFSLTAFTIGRKRKEIGVRKAYGATTPAVLILLQKDFGKLVLISSFIALPAGYYIIEQWLNSYASHIRLTPLYFLAAFLIIVIISAVTLIFHTIKAANLNPADTLRNE
jgi:ABC-type antimicrobial peptide transport system permease subunit